MIKRDRPYAHFTFLVSLGAGGSAPPRPDAGFQELRVLGVEVGGAEHRHGAHKPNDTIKVTGLGKSADVTLKRGVMASDTFSTWLDDIRHGRDTTRIVRIERCNEENTHDVHSWILHGTRVATLSHASLNAAPTEIAIEEMTLSFERMEVE
jgi:phage tail-like protein